MNEKILLLPPSFPIPPISTTYGGWIKVGSFQQEKFIKELRKCGVQDKMIFNKKTRSIEHCLVDEKIMKKIMKKFPDNIFPPAFTAIGAYGQPLLEVYQKFWRWKGHS